MLYKHYKKVFIDPSNTSGYEKIVLNFPKSSPPPFFRLLLCQLLTSLFFSTDLFLS